jgi:hypothetical protein
VCCWHGERQDGSSRVGEDCPRMDESLGVLESPRARGRVPSERRHFVLGARKWMHGPERSRQRALERKFDMEAISVPKDQLPSKYSRELDDRADLGDRL